MPDESNDFFGENLNPDDSFFFNEDPNDRSEDEGLNEGSSDEDSDENDVSV